MGKKNLRPVISPADVMQAALDLGKEIYNGKVEREQYKNEISRMALAFKAEREADKNDFMCVKELIKSKKAQLEAIKELKSAKVSEDVINEFMKLGYK